MLSPRKIGSSLAYKGFGTSLSFIPSILKMRLGLMFKRSASSLAVYPRFLRSSLTVLFLDLKAKSIFNSSFTEYRAGVFLVNTDMKQKTLHQKRGYLVERLMFAILSGIGAARAKTGSLFLIYSFIIIFA